MFWSKLCRVSLSVNRWKLWSVVWTSAALRHVACMCCCSDVRRCMCSGHRYCYHQWRRNAGIARELFGSWAYTAALTVIVFACFCAVTAQKQANTTTVSAAVYAQLPNSSRAIPAFLRRWWQQYRCPEHMHLLTSEQQHIQVTWRRNAAEASKWNKFKWLTKVFTC